MVVEGDRTTSTTPGSPMKTVKTRSSGYGTTSRYVEVEVDVVYVDLIYM